MNAAKKAENLVDDVVVSSTLSPERKGEMVTPARKSTSKKKKATKKGNRPTSTFTNYMSPPEAGNSDTAKTRRAKAGPNFFL